MITLAEIFIILIVHWILDFILQTNKQAQGKSTSFKYLLNHTIIYSFGWFVLFLFFYSIYGWKMLILFPLITFIAHTATDYYTSKVNAQLYKEGKTHDFFVSIGFDQVLHYIQLFTTYYILSRY